MDRGGGILGTIAQGDDGQDRLVLGNVEQFTQFSGIAHTHDERVKAHGARLQDQIGIAQAVVVSAPQVPGLIDGRTAEKARLARLESGDEEDRCIDDAVLVTADKFQHGRALFLADGDIVLAGLLIGPGRSVLRSGEQIPHFGLGNGLSGLIGPDAPPGSEDFVQGRRSGLVTVSCAARQQKGCEETDKRMFHKTHLFRYLTTSSAARHSRMYCGAVLMQHSFSPQWKG